MEKPIKTKNKQKVGKSKEQIRLNNESKYLEKYGKKKPDPISEWGESRTKSEFKDECDINKVLKRHGVTDLMRQGINNLTLMGDIDVSQVDTYEEMVQVVKNAEDAFNAVPSHVRKRFSNDPGEMIDFLKDPSNKDEAIKLGLVNALEQTPALVPEGQPTGDSLPPEGGSSGE